MGWGSQLMESGRPQFPPTLRPSSGRSHPLGHLGLPRLLGHLNTGLQWDPSPPTLIFPIQTSLSPTVTRCLLSSNPSLGGHANPSVPHSQSIYHIPSWPCLSWWSDTSACGPETRAGCPCSICCHTPGLPSCWWLWTYSV